VPLPQLFTQLGKTKCLEDASVSKLDYKMKGVIFKLLRKLWQWERQLRDDATCRTCSLSRWVSQY
jgi:hypothetical protein